MYPALKRDAVPGEARQIVTIGRISSGQLSGTLTLTLTSTYSSIPSNLRSIPIVSREDYMNPAFHAPYACGQGNASWNTVAASPYAKAVSVETWQDLPVLLDRLRNESDDFIETLQVGVGFRSVCVCSRVGSGLGYGFYISPWWRFSLNGRKVCTETC